MIGRRTLAATAILVAIAGLFLFQLLSRPPGLNSFKLSVSSVCLGRGDSGFARPIYQYYLLIKVTPVDFARRGEIKWFYPSTNEDVSTILRYIMSYFDSRLKQFNQSPPAIVHVLLERTVEISQGELEGFNTILKDCTGEDMETFQALSKNRP